MLVNKKYEVNHLLKMCPDRERSFSESEKVRAVTSSPSTVATT